MPSSADSIISGISTIHPFSYGDSTSIIGENPSWYQEPLSPTDELPLLSKFKQSRQGFGRPSKRVSVPPVVHTRSLQAGADNIPLLTANLHSWATSPNGPPSYVEGQFISGQVQLNLKTPDRVKTVSVSLEGYYSIPGHEAKTFLQVTDILWDSTMGDPRSTVGMFMSKEADHTTKLHGKYSWSFKFEFPTTLQITGKEERRIGIRSGERLPPSLKGGHAQPRIGYEVVVRIKRTGLRAGNSLTIPITYMISTQPYSESIHRRPAYQQNQNQNQNKDSTPISILFDNPSEWTVFPEFQVNGSYNRSQTSFTCTLALSDLLSHVRGSFVPCTLVVTCSNQQLLEVIASPAAPQVVLRRKLVLYSKLGGELALEGQEIVVSKTVWRPVREIVRTPVGFTRVLQGGIKIPLTAMPSFTFGRLEMKYDVLVCPFDCSGFTRIGNGPILTVDVDVVTTETP